MNVIFRNPHILNGRYVKKYCHHCQTMIQCVCGSNVWVGSANKYFSNRQITSSTVLGLSDSQWQNSNIPSKSLLIRNISISRVYFDKEPLKPSSKVEVTVQELKKKKEEIPVEVQKKVVKKSIKQKVWDELLHYYHGFRLLFIDIKISYGLIKRILNGKSLSRREYRLLTRTVGDMFRLVPFSVFIIIPFMEFLLPFFIKFFPNALPSTFQTATEREDKLKQSLKVNLEMAKFLQQTLDEMSLQHKDHNSQQAKEFSEWFKKIRTSGEQVSNDEILRFAKLFEDEITLDSLSRSQLVALCRVLEVQTLGTNNLLRFQLRMKLRSLAADDKMIQKEGIDSLTLHEVQQACKARGMRAYGVSEARLRSQLAQWLDLSLNEKVPPSLLLMSRALMLPETIPTSDKLKATISVLPEAIVTQTKAAIGEKEGKIDNKVKIEVLKEEERKVLEERQERREEKKTEEEAKKKELLEDKAPVITQETTPTLEDPAKIITDDKVKPKEDVQLNRTDVEAIEAALDTISNEKKKLIVEKEEIEDLKEELKDYKEDVSDLEKTVAELPTKEIQETKGAKRLYKKVNKLVDKMDSVISELAKSDKNKEPEAEELTDKKKKQLLKVDDIIDTIKVNIADESRLDHIKKLLLKIDDDSDGALEVEDVLKLIDVIGKENVKLSGKQIDELIELLEKEELLEIESKIQKALEKEKTEDVKEEKAKKDDDENNPPNEKPKTKMDPQSISVPPIASIDSTKKQNNNSKML